MSSWLFLQDFLLHVIHLTENRSKTYRKLIENLSKKFDRKEVIENGFGRRSTSEEGKDDSAKKAFRERRFQRSFGKINKQGSCD